MRIVEVFGDVLLLVILGVAVLLLLSVPETISCATEKECLTAYDE